MQAALAAERRTSDGVDLYEAFRSCTALILVASLSVRYPKIASRPTIIAVDGSTNLLSSCFLDVGLTRDMIKRSTIGLSTTIRALDSSDCTVTVVQHATEHHARNRTVADKHAHNRCQQRDITYSQYQVLNHAAQRAILSLPLVDIV